MSFSSAHMAFCASSVVAGLDCTVSALSSSSSHGHVGFGSCARRCEVVRRRRCFLPTRTTQPAGGTSGRVASTTVTRMAKGDSTSGETPRWQIGLGLLVIVFALATPLVLPIFDQGTGLEEKEISRRLNQVPVFSVTDASGKPFLNEVGGKNIGYFFFDPKEAEDFLGQVRKVNRVDGADSRIFPVTLDEAYKFVSGQAGNGDVFQLRPPAMEIEEAQKILGGDFQGSVPLFFVDGLAFQSQTGEDSVIPLFFDKNDLDKTLAKLKRENPNISSQLPDTYSVIDLGGALDEMKTGRNANVKKVVFYPSEESLDFLRALKAAASSKS